LLVFRATQEQEEEGEEGDPSPLWEDEYFPTSLVIHDDERRKAAPVPAAIARKNLEELLLPQ
jgi:hypothetical protein